MEGCYGRVLNIDLATRKWRVTEVPEEIQQNYLGGKGLATHLLLENNPVGVDPRAPENCLIFATGPATGSAVWGGCRYGVFTKSPLTGFYAESYSGGKVPEAIAATGFDAILIQGACAAPTVLSVSPKGVVFHDAGDLWGQETYATEDAVHERFHDAQAGYKRRGAVVIGPAAENGIRFALIKNDHWRSAGRAGVGTVMGSKRLKAILFQGDRKRRLHDEAALRALAKRTMVEGRDHPGVKAYKSMGTSQMVKIMNSAGAFPTRYWSRGVCPHWEDISADALHTRCEVVPRACLKCFMACGRMTRVREGRHAGLKIEGPEYETIYAFGGLCLIDAIEEIIHLNDLCDRLGMDTITAGNLCAFTIEAVRRGKVDYPIDYGDADGVAALLRLIAAREDIGAVLAQGLPHAAALWDLEDLAVHVKGMEPAGYDPRPLKGMGLAYATADRGACHLRATFYKPELSGMIPPDQVHGKAELFVDFEDRLTLFDALVLCRFYRDLYPWDLLQEMIQALTGMDADVPRLRRMAADIATLTRRFNIREGLTPADDRLPRKLHRRLEDSGQVVTEAEIETMVQDYYRLRGWDAHGTPKT
jgi:aldehyde:ferredoxin oxidoreductase